MSTWQIFSDSDNSFRWETSDAQGLTKPVEEASGAPTRPYDYPSRLPSMVDLLLQGCSKILQSGVPCVESPPMFRTGLGKSVTVKQSSIAKALSVLGDEDFGPGGQDQDRDNRRGFMNSLFQSGSGKMVNISSAGLVRAKTLLGLEENDNHRSCQERITKQSMMDGLDGQNSSSLEMQEGLNSRKIKDAESIARPFSTSTSWKTESINEVSTSTCCIGQDHDRDNRCGFTNSLFQTGSGKAVNISSAGLVKAKTLLGLEENNNHRSCQEHITKQSMMDGLGGQNSSSLEMQKDLNSIKIKDAESVARPFSTSTSWKTEAINEVSISTCCTGQDHDRDNRCGFTNSLFQTGSGKVVNISSAGLVRAKTLLGLEENNNHRACQEHITKQSMMDGLDGQNSSSLEMQKDLNSIKIKDAELVARPFSTSTSWKTESINESVPNLKQSEMYNPASNPPPIKFLTAGGRSISVSTDALQRAKSLLGDPELGTSLNEGDEDDMIPSFLKGSFWDVSSNKENDSDASLSQAKSKNASKTFISPIRSFPNRVQSSVMPENMYSGSNLIKKYTDDSQITCPQKPLSNRHCAPHTIIDNSEANGKCSINKSLGRPSRDPLVDVSNRIGTVLINKKQATSEKRRLGRRSSTSPFKRPRSSKFCPPLNINASFPPNGLSSLASEDTCSRKRVSTRYPFNVPRMYIKEFFGDLPFKKNVLEHLSDEVRWMNPDNAEKYMFPDEYGLGFVGVNDLCQRLARSGASMQYASKEWISNHYKWIIWKLACYERCYPAKHSGRLLTMSNVLEELTYRYEREVNHGHRSAIKRILEGDASPSTMVVLCFSAIRSTCDLKIGTHPAELNGSENSNAAKVELTDGWYSIDAFLDAPLSNQLFSGKLFVGQKLRIWGAGLCGWVGPVSPLETSKTAALLLHINGTYRARWADRLGFCKAVGPPLAFRCIKSNGGSVPQTLVRVTRIYPILYRERLSNGGSIVRSERTETKMMQLYNQRRSTVVEGIISEFQRGTRDSCINNDSDGEEGAKIFKILETAAEPEVLMAEMTSEQLASFTSYQAKLEAMRQSDLQKSIEMALENAGLSTREVTPFMRVRVVGLTCKSYEGKIHHKDGLITIWNPTEKQQFELVEGQAYVVAGLMPLNSDSNTLYLQARGSSTKWNPLSPLAIEDFGPFSNPRKSVLLSNLGEIPLSSEFDIAALVVYVGEVYTTAHQKKQWVFVTDGSVSELGSEEASNSLLAISFCAASVDDSFAPVNHNLKGSIVGFVNLIKRAKDQMNHLWVAEATENSDYFFSFDLPHCLHLKNAAAYAERWAKTSNLTIEKLKEKVLLIIGDCKG